MNTHVPALVAERYRAARIVAFSTGNVYGLAAASASPAPTESDARRRRSATTRSRASAASACSSTSRRSTARRAGSSASTTRSTCATACCLRRRREGAARRAGRRDDGPRQRHLAGRRQRAGAALPRPLHDADDADQRHRRRRRSRSAGSRTQLAERLGTDGEGRRRGGADGAALRHERCGTRCSALRSCRSRRMLDWVADWVSARRHELRQADQVRGPRWRVLKCVAIERLDSRATSPAGSPCRMPPAGTRAPTTGVLHRRRRGFGVRDERGTLIATAAALPYDAATGWISMVLVDARTAIAASPASSSTPASRRCATRGCIAVLDATPAGAAVYARIGFVAGFAFERWEGDGAARVGDEPRAATMRPSAVAAGSHAADADRSRPRRRAASTARCCSRSFLARPATRAWRAPRRRRLRAAPRRPHARPRSARSSPRRRRRASTLLAAALDGVAGRVFIDVPVQRTALAAAARRAAASRGSARSSAWRSATRAAPAARERVFALAGPEFG